jgi:hypothetical protein
MERYLTLRLELLGVERSVVLSLRRDRRINATLLRAIERDLDLEEARLIGTRASLRGSAYVSSSRKPTFNVTWKCATVPFSR